MKTNNVFSQAHSSRRDLQRWSRRVLNSPLPNISTPGRNQRIEERILAKVLETCAGEFEYPVLICKRETPDFCIKTYDGKVIGIEVTEKPFPHLLRIEARATRSGEIMWFDAGELASRPEKISRREFDALRNPDKLPGRGWIGSELDRQWLEALGETIEKKIPKIERARKDGGFGQIWLGIEMNYFRLRPRPLIEDDIRETVRQACDHAGRRPFDRIFVFYNAQGWVISQVTDGELVVREVLAIGELRRRSCQ